MRRWGPVKKITLYLVDQLNDPLYCSLTLRPNKMSNQPSDGPVLVVGDVIERQIINIEKIYLGINKKLTILKNVDPISFDKLK